MKYLISLLATLILAGCAGVMAYTEGTKITPEMEQELIIGSTTTDEVKVNIGYPDSISQDGGLTHYIYNYTEINHIAPNVSEKVVLEFDTKGKLKNIVKGKGSSSNPLLQ